eukprot:CAMPEP_0203647008 /NCGR_PEP_ID=MMETSP0088-20131115/14462_1 /ASSEMBLY_ACC=CAM_ASM_001087 /TAXON_ID=426623 /ORGANISM="Chaetoceros affinis, Strain CCMP159" /LENGTH=43 /DNA_ID= /DNA_START= /DNA_END= /DNA_ORIENTATION=
MYTSPALSSLIFVAVPMQFMQHEGLKQPTCGLTQYQWAQQVAE